MFCTTSTWLHRFCEVFEGRWLWGEDFRSCRAHLLFSREEKIHVPACSVKGRRLGDGGWGWCGLMERTHTCVHVLC